MSTRKSKKTDLVSDRIAQTKKALLEALEKSLGVVTAACKIVGVSRDTFYRYYADDEEFQRQVDGMGEVALDFVESQLFRIIKEGNPAGIIFYMKTKGRKRGYQENVNMEHTGQLKTEQHVFDYSKLSDAALKEIIEASTHS